MQIEDLINNVANQDFSKAGPLFKDILQGKLDDALEQEKIAVASTMFNGDDDVDPDEEDIDDAIAELDDDDDDDQEEIDFDDDDDDE